MTNEEYKKFAKKYMPKEEKYKKEFISFIVGGFMGVLAEFLVVIIITKFNTSHDEAVNLMMIILIFISCLLTGIGIFDEFVKKAGAGLFIPITGFAHSTAASAIEYKKEGLVFGIGSNMFKMSGTVIVYAIVSSFVFGLIRFLIFGG